jgi:probable phosphoglycerate mutase
MIIHFIRHGETDFHAGGRYAGQLDISLNANGLDQSRNLTKWIEGINLDLIVSSDLKRAVETATELSGISNRKLKIDSRFREIDFGVLSGLSREEIRLKHPAIYDVFFNFPTQASFPDGESVEAAMDRTLFGLLDLVNDVRLSEILIVCHATLFRLVLCVLLGLNPDQYRTHFSGLKNASITTIEIPKNLIFKELSECANLIRYDEEFIA